MTDKELRKLSRLELLELLLEAGKENEKLKDEIKNLKAEKQNANKAENLYVAACKIETALKYATCLTDTLKKTSDLPQAPSESAHIKSSSENQEKPNQLTDKEIYRRMLLFFANNDDKLSIFPADVEYDVRNRINSLLAKKKKKS